ncbi:ATP-binding protein [Candidatus Woesearchaeota archaeon]|nr:ATP-binding protein [Candidatus Woesearchaeota archaeon]
MKTITILSGKGGVGKSSISASLAVLLAKKNKIIAVDCDVDAPNLALVLGLKKYEKKETIQTSEKAKLIPSKCIGCKKCMDTCIFGAITWDKKKNKPIFDKYLCEGCGACELVCPANAIKLDKVKNAVIGFGKTKYKFPIFSGQLKMGESGSGKVVTAVKAKAENLAKTKKFDYILSDSSPGIGCPVIASIQGSDFIVAITEPNPATLNDLKRVLQVVEHFRVPYGIIINRWDINKEFSEKIVQFARKNNMPLLGKIPYDKAFVDALVNLTPIVTVNKKYEQLFSKILDNILKYL